MAPPPTDVADIRLQFTTHLATPKNERLSWPGWWTCIEQFTHIVATHGQAQDRESSPAKERRSTTMQRNQPLNLYQTS